MNWYGPTGDCGCCSPCPVWTACWDGEQRERTPREITIVLENLPDEIYYRIPTQPQGYLVSGNTFTPYYIFARLGNIKSLEGTYTIYLQEVPQVPTLNFRVACSYTRISSSPPITVQAEVTPDASGCPSILVPRSITSVSSQFTMAALFDTARGGPNWRLDLVCNFGAQFTIALNTSPSYEDSRLSYGFGALWGISESVTGGFFSGLKFCAFRNGRLKRIVNSEVTDCAAYGPQPDDDSTWQYD